MRIFLFPAFVILFFLFSCKSQQKITNYLQHIDTAGTLTVTMPEPRIQKGDLLSVKVYSQSADPRTDIPYNLPEQTSAGTTSAATGFLVDEEGNIDYPRVGTLHVEGLKKEELAQALKEKLVSVLNSPSVIVRFLNYRITVLGEVSNPGNFSLPTERVTILEALGLAGDITEYGRRDSVKVAREVNGQMQIGYVNLTSGELFASPYYRLQQNDVVFVEQNKRKEDLAVVQQQQVFAQRLGIVASIVSTLAIVYSLIRR